MNICLIIAKVIKYLYTKAKTRLVLCLKKRFYYIHHFLKWYLEHDLIITKFYKAIEYNKNVCFKELGESIADARRAGDADKSMEIIAKTMILIGNSSYGRCVMNKERHMGGRQLSS